MPKLLFTTEVSLQRLLQTFASRLGVDPTYADVLAQTHLQIDPAVANVNTFIRAHCLHCKHDPETCVYMSPTPADIAGRDVTPRDVQHANMLMIETARIVECPGFEEPE